MKISVSVQVSRWGQRSLLAIATLILLGPMGHSAPTSAPKRGMVTAAHPLASQAGLAMLRQGGNAVDAAVATTFAISVVEPFSAGIGGGGFLLLRQPDNSIRALDFRERAPLAATRDMYLDAQGNPMPRASVDGYLAVGTPGTIAGMYELHQRYGKLPWAVVLAPAIALADRGFPVSARLHGAIARRAALQQSPAARAIFLPQAQPLQPGETLIQRDLARTLRLVAQDPQTFYTGSIAQAIARDMQANGGLLTRQDLATYRPIWREPVCGPFRQVRVCSMPPPSSGGVHLLQILTLVGDLDLRALGWHHPDALHWLVESMRVAYADRAEYLGDPDFVDVPVAALLSPAYLARRRQAINPQRATPVEQIKPLPREVLDQYSQRSERTETSHLNVVDGSGQAVSLTFTVNLGFGAAVVVPGTGIVLNNEMDDFAIAPGVPNAFGLVGGEANAIAPRKTPLSSMTPTIVTENGQLRLVTGSPGGSTIITTVTQILLNVLVYDMSAQQAVAAPRLHHQWRPDALLIQQWGFDTLTLAALRQRGHTLVERAGWGNANLIIRHPDGRLEGAVDPRGEGGVAGY